MGVVRSTVSFGAESFEEFPEILLLLQQQQRFKANIGESKPQNSLLHDGMFRGRGNLKSTKAAGNISEEGIVCVTSGISFLGFTLANSLLSRGYTVRLLVDSPEDLDKVQEMQMFGSGRAETTVVADMMNIDALIQAFQNCTCVFHTSAFTDPAGLSGYSKHMADLEAKIAERVIEACVNTRSVRKCVFTSSLLSCIWRCPDQNQSLNPIVVDENSWTNESVCRSKKLWYALGKTMAEKAAWKAAHGRDIKLVTLCPGLVTGPGFIHRNSAASIAYLKGAQGMLRQGLLATVDVVKLAEMHISVFEAAGRTNAHGRYICFDYIVQQAQDVDRLVQQLGIPTRVSVNDVGSNESAHAITLFQLCKRKVDRLMSSSRSCSDFLQTSLRLAYE